MKYLIPSAVVAGVVAIAAGSYIDRDFAVASAQYANSATYVLVAVSLIPLISGINKSLLAPGLFGIALSSITIMLYTAIAITLDRSHWWLEGWPSMVYLFAIGCLTASLGHHLIALGEVQGLRAVYMALFGAFLVGGTALGWVLVLT